MREKFSKLVDDLSYTFALAEIRIKNELKDDLSLNTSFYQRIICKEPGRHTISSIAKLLSVKTTAVTQKVNELESKNYVVRKQSDSDKRISYLCGAGKFCPSQEAFEKRNKQVFSMLQEVYSPEELAKFLEILEKTNALFAAYDARGEE